MMQLVELSPGHTYFFWRLVMGLMSRLHKNKSSGKDWEIIGGIAGVEFWLIVEWAGFADGLVWEWSRKNASFLAWDWKKELLLAEMGKLGVTQAQFRVCYLWDAVCVELRERACAEDEVKIGVMVLTIMELTLTWQHMDPYSTGSRLPSVSSWEIKPFSA